MNSVEGQASDAFGSLINNDNGLTAPSVVAIAGFQRPFLEYGQRSSRSCIEPL
jgi:hypothetical protein